MSFASRSTGIAKLRMRLAFLAPDIAEAIRDGHQPANLELERLMKAIPVSGDEQRRDFGFSLDRIRLDRTHDVGSIDPVNPVYTYKVEQIHGR